MYVTMQIRNNNNKCKLRPHKQSIMKEMKINQLLKDNQYPSKNKTDSILIDKIDIIKQQRLSHRNKSYKRLLENKEEFKCYQNQNQLTQGKKYFNKLSKCILESPLCKKLNQIQQISSKFGRKKHFGRKDRIIAHYNLNKKTNKNSILEQTRQQNLQNTNKSEKDDYSKQKYSFLSQSIIKKIKDKCNINLIPAVSLNKISNRLRTTQKTKLNHGHLLYENSYKLQNLIRGGVNFDSDDYSQYSSLSYFNNTRKQFDTFNQLYTNIKKNNLINQLSFDNLNDPDMISMVYLNQNINQLVGKKQDQILNRLKITK